MCVSTVRDYRAQVNVVRRSNATGAESNVPCYESYNHHFTASIASKHVELTAQPVADLGMLHSSHTDGRGSRLEPLYLRLQQVVR